MRYCICHFQKVHARQTSTSLAPCQSSIKQHNLPGNEAPDHHFAGFQTADLNSIIFFTESLCADMFSQISPPSTLCCFEPLFCPTQMSAPFFVVCFFFCPCDSYRIKHSEQSRYHTFERIGQFLSRLRILPVLRDKETSQEVTDFYCLSSHTTPLSQQQLWCFWHQNQYVIRT